MLRKYFQDLVGLFIASKITSRVSNSLDPLCEHCGMLKMKSNERRCILGCVFTESSIKRAPVLDVGTTSVRIINNKS